jgi:hypothetical protein
LIGTVGQSRHSGSMAKISIESSWLRATRGYIEGIFEIELC